MAPLPRALARRPTYALPALQHYLSHISLPASHQRTILQHLPTDHLSAHPHPHPGALAPTEWGTSAAGLSLLATLQKYQQARIPFANLYLHYSSHHVGTPLDMEGLWRYLVRGEAMVGTGAAAAARRAARLRGDGAVLDEGGEKGAEEQIMTPASQTRRELGGTTDLERKWAQRLPSGGRGGTCTLNNGFFGTVMRSLGMRVMSTGARVAYAGHEGMFMGWNHLVNLVRVQGSWFLVDVGFGGDGPTAPIELIDGLEMPWGSTSSLVRLIHAPIPEFTDPSSKVWILQHKRPSREWRHVYCFTTTEFMPQDIKVMNYSTTGDIRGSFFNHFVVCSRTIMEGEDVVGTIGLVGGKLKRRICDLTATGSGGSMESKDSQGNGNEEAGGWRSEVLMECRSEVERWEALEKWFGIVLSEDERLGIRGMVGELKGEWGA